MVQEHEKIVVVGIDGTAESLGALRWALNEAVTLEADVEVVHCYLPQTLTDFAFGKPRELHTASVIMVENEVKTALGDMPQPPEVRRCSVTGDPAKVLRERAATASLLVLGAHSQTALRDLVLGRIAQSCIRRAPCPIVVVDRDQNIVRRKTPAARRH